MIRHQNGYLLRLVYILGPPFLLIYINDLSNDLVSTIKLFADDTSLFSIVHDINISAKGYNNNLQKIFEWAYKWKMSFDSDLNRQAQEIIFSRKLNKPSHQKIIFVSAPVVCADLQKHLGMYLDIARNFNLHIKEKLSKGMKGILVIQKLSKTFPRRSLITICKSFVRPHLDSGDIIYGQRNDECFTHKEMK